MKHIDTKILSSNFQNLCAVYTDDMQLVNAYWEELYTAYTSAKRYYHNLAHLEHLYTCLALVKEDINQWDEILFALFYHDVVYKSSKQNNEEKSAEKASEVLNRLGAPSAVIDFVVAAIMATKKHEPHQEDDINYFTDADLAILGEARNLYEVYCLNVRKEYSMYPDLLYKPGRKKVLQHFLSMARIYKTDFFYNKYEMAARNNLQQELASLSR